MTQERPRFQWPSGLEDWTLTPIKDDASRVEGLVFSLSDVTEKVLARQELAKAERLRAFDEVRNAFIRGTSHELRTPLTVVLGLAETLAREDMHLITDEARSLVERLVHNAHRLERLVADLLDVDRLSRGVVQPRRTPTDVVALARTILEQVDMLGHPVNLEAEPIEFSVDAPMLERALENLVTNAVRHTPGGTRVWVRLCREAGGLLVIVEDAGPGVPDDLKEAIFEPFRQGSAVSPHAPGVGIGLSLVMLFAKLHGGRAWVEDRPGGGASFRVLLPEDASGMQEHRE